MRYTLLAVLTLLPAALGAQSARTISPGMSRAQVVAALGEPTTLRTVSDFTYLFYTNACGKRCGMNDLVVLRADSVVDAIFRSPDRQYTGKSSSPKAISPEEAAREKGTAGAPLTVPAKTPAPPRRIAPGPANDIKPSIPVNPPTLAPAPTPATKKP
jgi:hypothetical protein